VDADKLTELLAATEGKVKYRLNAKPKAGQDPATIKKSDCSGYLHWLIPQIATEHCGFPDGSWMQHKWCKDHGFKASAYNADGAGRRDHRLRIAFIEPQGDKPGHVWLLKDGQTIECCSGKGVCRRPWDTAVLLAKSSAVYVLTDPMD
jgi:hypothetical protein